jgi:hypothetical protein
MRLDMHSRKEILRAGFRYHYSAWSDQAVPSVITTGDDIRLIENSAIYSYTVSMCFMCSNSPNILSPEQSPAVSQNSPAPMRHSQRTLAGINSVPSAPISCDPPPPQGIGFFGKSTYSLPVSVNRETGLLPRLLPPPLAGRSLELSETSGSEQLPLKNLFKNPWAFAHIQIGS